MNTTTLAALAALLIAGSASAETTITSTVSNAFYVAQTDKETQISGLEAGNPFEVAGQDRRSFLTFDLSAVFAASENNVKSAIFRIYRNDNDAGLNQYGSAFLYSLNSAFDADSATPDWDQLTGTSRGTILTSDDGTNQYFEVDVTALVQSWKDTPSSYFGFAIQTDETYAGTGKTFVAGTETNKPELVVTLVADTTITSTVSNAFYVAQTDKETQISGLEAGNPFEVAGQDRRSFLTFDLSAVFAASENTVGSAIFRIYRNDNDAGLNQYGSAFLYSLNSAFDADSATPDWDQLTGTSRGTILTSDDGTNQYFEVDVTALVQSWKDSPSSYFGFAIQTDEPFAGTGKTFVAGTGTNRPELVVTLIADPFATWINEPNWPGLADRSASGDPDNDGIKNLMEYVLQGGNPSVSTTGTLPTLDASGLNLVFTYYRRAAATGTTQTFEYGSNLSGWTPVAIPGGSGVSVTPNDPSPGIDKVEITVAKGAETKLFGRLKVTQP